MKDIHSLQIKILGKLLYSSILSYTKLKPDKEIENNLFDYHLNQLIKEGYISKSENGYALTNKGKDFANRIDEQNSVMTKQAKISAWVTACRIVKGKWYFLIMTRLKMPFYGCQGFLSGKVRHGETIIDAAKRELYEETKMEGESELIYIAHYHVYNKIDMTLLEDKIMFMCRFMNPTGKLVPSNEGKYEWISEDDLKRYVTKPYEDYSIFQKHINLCKNFKTKIIFEEINEYSEKF